MAIKDYIPSSQAVFNVIATVGLAVLTWYKADPTPVVVPVPTPDPIVIPAGRAFVTNEAGDTLTDAEAKPIIDAIAVGDGRFNYVGYPVKGKPIYRTLTIAGGVTPPVPVPPVPPPVPPKPEPDVPVVGPRGILIARESARTTPEFARLITALRNGTSAEYFTSKKHRLDVLDVDVTDADGKPSPIVESWKPHLTGLTLPAEIIYDPAAKTILSKRSIPAGTTADNVVESVRKVGG